jgi:predicted nucleic-acid-binding Zn-ribbon protein
MTYRTSNWDMYEPEHRDEYTYYVCDNCGYGCDKSELNDIRDLEQRLDFPIGHPDCIEPAGECPKCGCLSYEED